MVFSMSAFGTYFKLMQSGPSNSSRVGLLEPISAEPVDVHVGLAWLAVGSMCLFIAGEKGLRGTWVRIVVPVPVAHHASFFSIQLQI